MLWLSFLLLSLAALAQAKKDSPEVTPTDFDGRPLDIRYFEDSETVLAFVAKESGIRSGGTLWRSTNAGGEWKKADDVDEDALILFTMHPYDKEKAYALGAHSKHWYTNDQGKSWHKFELPDGYSVIRTGMPFSFHGTDSNKIIMNTRKCDRGPFFCKESAHYTTDGFNSEVKNLRPEAYGCIFAHSTPIERNEGDHQDRALCIVLEKRGILIPDISDQRALYSDDFFKTEHEPKMDNGRTVSGIINMADVKGYIVAAQKSKGTKELNLFVSLDGANWDKARFPHDHKLEQDAYTVLESTNYSLQVNVMTNGVMRPPMGTLFTSDSTGVTFTENIQHVNRNGQGFVDFEKIQNIQGIILVNVVGNYEEVLEDIAAKKKQSKISFDDGRTFQPLTVLDGEGDKKNVELHLHSVTTPSNIGRIYSGAAPGIVMGVGNTGKELRPYKECDLYVSDDAGLTWRKSLDEAHKYEFGDQGSILVAIYDEGETSEIKYNLQHGKPSEWKTIKLDEKVNAQMLTTVPDSTSLKFILAASVKGGKSRIYSIDFDGLHERKCEDEDFEDWPARKDDKGEPACLMGHTQWFRRRKTKADCFVENIFNEPTAKPKDCPCEDQDFECDHDFMKGDDNVCLPMSSFKVPDGACRDEKDAKFKGPTGYRKIPGNTCKDGKSLDEGEKEWKCDIIGKPSEPPSNSDKVVVTPFKFKGSKAFTQKVYLEKPATGSGEDTVITRTDKGDIWRTTDSGKTWEQLDFGDDKIIAIWSHQYYNDRVFFLTRGEKAYLSAKRGADPEEFKVPSKPVSLETGIRPLSFHEEDPAWVIWTGEKNGQTVAEYTLDLGRSWDPLMEDCKRCEFIKQAGRGSNKKLVYCEKYKERTRNSPVKLLSSNDWFKDDSHEHFEDIVAFATMSEFIIVANKDDESNLKIDASIDAETFAEAKFPKGFSVPHQTAYTLLDSSTHSVFLQVTESEMPGFEYGRLMKSNSNGTSYVLSIPNVNQSPEGFVDFEKMQGLEGVAMVNVVENIDDRDSGGKEKRLRTKITHNDGAEWDYIKFVTDEENNPFTDCGPKDMSCSLNLHGYTERADPSDTYSSPSAIGLMVATGNVGTSLDDSDEATQTFITADAGIKWRRVREGKYMWEFGDQGSIVVLAKDGGSTDEILYSTDRGIKWNPWQFSKSKVRISDLTTVPSDSSPNFIIWGTNEDGELHTYNLDFSGLFGNRICDQPNDEEGNEGDYEVFEPQHPASEGKCLFGHVASYHRKKPDANCWNGRQVQERHGAEVKNCDCTRHDYEW